MKITIKNVRYMLNESNVIEGVFTREALDNAYSAWLYLISKDIITTADVKLAHNILMQDLNLEPKYQGDWRDVPVRIGGEVKSQPKIVIDSLMQDWCNDLNTLVRDKSEEDPILHHLRFENIHPFIDGNGRMGRLLMNWHCAKTDREMIVFIAEEKYEKYYPLFKEYKGKL